MNYIQISKFKVTERQHGMMSIILEWFDLNNSEKEIDVFTIETEPHETDEQIMDIASRLLGNNYEIIEMI